MGRGIFSAKVYYVFTVFGLVSFSEKGIYKSDFVIFPPPKK